MIIKTENKNYEIVENNIMKKLADKNDTNFRQATLSNIPKILVVQKKFLIDAFVDDKYGITLEMVENFFVGKETRLTNYFETGSYFVAEIS